MYIDLHCCRPEIIVFGMLCQWSTDGCETENKDNNNGNITRSVQKTST